MGKTTGYRHTQIGYATIGLFGVLGLSALLGFLVEHDPIAAGFGIFFLLLVANFHSLTVSVEDDALVVAFGPGLIKVRFKLRDIESCEKVENSPWFGWGIQLMPRGWLYNVSGMDAVEIRLRSGAIYGIGTDEPLKLEEAVRRAIGKTA